MTSLPQAEAVAAGPNRREEAPSKGRMFRFAAEMSLLGGGLSDLRKVQEVGRAVPSAPQASAKAGILRQSSDGRGALGTARPTSSGLGQHAVTSAPALRRLGNWLGNPRHTSMLWLGKHCVIVAWVGLLVAALMPPHGFGANLCWVYGTTGVPCPGCGVTRSLSCGLRGLWLESWNYHPMGLLILALFAFTAAQSLLPRAARERVTCWIQHHALAFNSAYLLFVLVFVCFGVVRALSHLIGIMSP